MKIAALYARVSGEQQRDSNTIASQTEELVAYAERQGYCVASDMIIKDDGFSGTVLERPGLERVRDLAAEGRIDVVVVHAPDRLSRRYAYQVLVIEELARQGVETVFVNAPSMETPEDHLLVQFQGMLAEYERAQILERSRRGKRHRARRGEVAVLSGAPYGYRYHKKTPDSEAFYEIVEPQASVVREVYRHYTCDHLSIAAITRGLNERAVPTSTGRSRWERSTVWAMLRNPAYRGKACFGKTRQMPRTYVTRPLRLSGRTASATTGGHEKPREEWIEVPVPAIVTEETFALAEERLAMNKTHSPRRTKTPSVVQGLVSCGKCGYALSRSSAQTTARRISYYRCLGSDSWRHLGGSLCDSRPVRQDLLDDVVWSEVVRLLQDPVLIGAEIDRRLEAARASDPNQQREADLRRRLIRVRKRIDRLINAYQEELITIDELRDRTPELRRQEQALHRELKSVIDRAGDRETYLRLAETLTGFMERLRSSAETLEITDRQRIVRLLVKDVLVWEDKIVIRHSIPLPRSASGGGPDLSKTGNDDPENESYLLRSGRQERALAHPLLDRTEGMLDRLPATIHHLGPGGETVRHALHRCFVLEARDAPIGVLGTSFA
jgi:site-specific DNA recombinase